MKLKNILLGLIIFAFVIYGILLYIGEGYFDQPSPDKPPICTTDKDCSEGLICYGSQQCIAPNSLPKGSYCGKPSKLCANQCVDNICT